MRDTIKGKNLPYFCPLIFEFCFSRDCHAFGLAMTIKRRLAMTNKKGAMTRCHCEEVRQATDDEAIPKLNPKLEALNPEEKQKSNIKSQNDKL
jgi:hypothetical protein